MCNKLLSTYERCGHQDNIAHIQYCNKILNASWPSVACPINGFSSPVYEIKSFCPKCQVLHAVVGLNGHLQEVPSSNSIAHEVPSSWKAREVVEIAWSKQNNDAKLEWKESGADGWGDGGVGDAGGWDSGVGGGGGDWDSTPVVESQVKFNETLEVIDFDGGVGGEWADQVTEAEAKEGASNDFGGW